MKLKFVLSFLFFVIFLTASNAQYRFKTINYATTVKSNNKWQKWSKSQKSEMIVELQTNKNRLVVYSEIIQLFNIVDYGEEKEDKNKNTVSFLCVDNQGIECTLTIVTLKDSSNINQLFITYEDMIIMYNMKLIKN